MDSNPVTFLPTSSTEWVKGQLTVYGHARWTFDYSDRQRDIACLYIYRATGQLQYNSAVCEECS